MVNVFHFHSYTFLNLKFLNAFKISITHHTFAGHAGYRDLSVWVMLLVIWFSFR